MFKKNKFNQPAFTMIELLVVVVIIGLLFTLSIVSLQNARVNARDAKRVADVKQIQFGLELYYRDQGTYPENIDNSIATGSITYVAAVPVAPTPADGNCSYEDNIYTYTQQVSGASYTVSFCLGGQTGDLMAGIRHATPDGVGNPPPAPWFCGDTLVDSRDNREYDTIQIGSQCWIAESLQYDNGCSTKTYINYTDVGWCSGTLYQWSAAMNGQTTEGARGICPVGWHVPSLADFQALSSVLGGDSVSGAKLKAGSPSWDGSNTSGFTALPEGYVDYDGGLHYVGQMSFIHTSSPVGPSSSNYINFIGGFSSIYYTNDPNSHARSVRCIKD